MGRDDWSGLEVGVSLPQISDALVIPPHVRPWLSCFLREWALLRTECLACLNVVPFPSLCWKQRGFFSLWFLLWEPGWALEVNLTILWGCPNDWISWEFLTQVGPYWASSNWIITVQASQPWPRIPHWLRQLCSGKPGTVPSDFHLSPVSGVGDGGFPSVLTSYGSRASKTSWFL